jgi:hypothetical protein
MPRCTPERPNDKPSDGSRWGGIRQVSGVKEVRPDRNLLPSRIDLLSSVAFSHCHRNTAKDRTTALQLTSGSATILSALP